MLDNLLSNLEIVSIVHWPIERIISYFVKRIICSIWFLSSCTINKLYAIYCPSILNILVDAELKLGCIDRSKSFIYLTAGFVVEFHYLLIFWNVDGLPIQQSLFDSLILHSKVSSGHGNFFPYLLIPFPTSFIKNITASISLRTFFQLL